VKLEHSFTVPADLDTVWEAVLDPDRVAPCMPGATLTEVDGDAFKGSVKVKMGPISLLYKGSGEFLTKDADSRTVVIKASGKDSRGNGTAAATVTVTLTEEGSSTTGKVVTDLSITGKPAQFGRGLISEVGGKILDTFAGCLASKLAPAPSPPTLSVVKDPPSEAPPSEPAGSGSAGSGSAGSEPAGSGSEGSAGSSSEGSGSSGLGSSSEGSGSSGLGAAGSGSGSAGSGSVGSAAAAKPAAAKPAAAKSGGSKSRASKSAAAGESAGSAASVESATVESAGASAAADRAEAVVAGRKAGEAAAKLVPVPGSRRKREPETEAIDLLSYAGPSVLKRLAPLVVLVALLVVFGMWRRRR
jgi:carbon monoxide dehydrogenase subunit G